MPNRKERLDGQQTRFDAAFEHEAVLWFVELGDRLKLGGYELVQNAAVLSDRHALQPDGASIKRRSGRHRREIRPIYEASS